MGWPSQSDRQPHQSVRERLWGGSPRVRLYARNDSWQNKPGEIGLIFSREEPALAKRLAGFVVVPFEICEAICCFKLISEFRSFAQFLWLPRVPYGREILILLQRPLRLTLSMG
jgi:hypothetical protein